MSTWSANRARAWLLRTAANFAEDDALEVEMGELAHRALDTHGAWIDEPSFRLVLEHILAWGPDEIDAAVVSITEEP